MKAVARSAEEILSAAKRIENPLALIVGEFRREPAAVVKQPQKSQILEMAVLCDKGKKGKAVKVQQSLVMLNINYCGNLKKWKSFSVRNATNGFHAQVFKVREKVFRTDFIQLNRGANTLTVESFLKDGQKHVQSLEIISGL